MLRKIPSERKLYAAIERICRTNSWNCGSWVVEVGKRDFSGRWIIETAKRKKALRLYNEHKSDIIGDFYKDIKHGNHSNMGFRFGENIEIKNRKGEKSIRQYAVDFNGTRELLIER